MLISKFRDSRRRAKQQILQTLGLATGSDDSEFDALHLEFKTTITALESIQVKMRAHATFLQQTHDKAAELTSELAAFHKTTGIAEAARELAKAHGDTAAVAAAGRLYDEQIIAPINYILWQAPEIETRVRERKTLLLDYNAHLRKYQQANVLLGKSDQSTLNATGLLVRRKSEAEMAEDVATRKVRVEHAEAALLESTEWLLNQFSALAEKREAGQLLDGSMQALVAVQKVLAKLANDKMDKAAPLFSSVGNYVGMLDRYVAEVRETAKTESDLLEEQQASAASAGSGAVFGRPLSGSGRVPAIVKECVSFLEIRGVQLEGVFRVPGNGVVVQALRERYDAGEIDCLTADTDAHDVATLLKLYFRELPQPVVNHDVYSQVIAVARDTNGDERREGVCSVVFGLPMQNLAVLGALLNLLQRIARNSATNKMNSTNLATCFAPTILRAPEDTSPVQVLGDMQWAITAFRVLIDEAKRFSGQRSRENSRVEASGINSSSSNAPHSSDLCGLPPRAPTSNVRSSVKADR